jgi:RNA polymerase sigma-70 factor (ECF subfamily)
MEAAELERVRRARNGDQEAFRGIVEAYSRPLWRAAFRVLGDGASAEDAVQDAFLRAWRALDRFDEQAELSTWLYRIAVNAAIDHRRERRRREGMDGAIPEDFDGQVAAASDAPDAHRQAYWREMVEHAQEAIAELPEAERTAILLRHFEGCSIADIAGALGGGEGAAKQAVFRAVRKLRAVLGPLMEMSRGESA